ncbi:uncharacterized protein PV09_08308 [Verruconis gallopava]|uniref:Uncharacterized protein n=1 Tax=Verruconis gallopava TaxID=253628 RepID=A0A0D1YH35_9PEZI|nr:uncharacterized protein PV09_08308 [Verruconis gallopava]KIW00127.1 hypothetical protein PV09_08308 [Verruconis gallopava]
MLPHHKSPHTPNQRFVPLSATIVEPLHLPKTSRVGRGYLRFKKACETIFAEMSSAGDELDDESDGDELVKTDPKIAGRGCTAQATWSSDGIREVSEEADHVTVIHEGKNKGNHPSARQRRLATRLAALRYLAKHGWDDIGGSEATKTSKDGQEKAEGNIPR